MPHLSFSAERNKNAEAIAIVRGGDADGNILYVHSDSSKSHLPKHIEINSQKHPMTHLKPKERHSVLSKMNRALDESDSDVEADPRTKQIYKSIKRDREQAHDITLPSDSSFQIIPSTDPTKRQIFYIAGASGSGKSYVARTIAENYGKLYPDRTVYLISKLSEDPVLDKLKTGKPKRIMIQSLLDEPVEDIEEFKNSLILFDDVDTFTGKEEKAVQLLMDDIAALGRHHCISMAIMTHNITNYKKTRLIINESTHFVLYPQATSFHSMKYLLSTHLGLEHNEVKDLKKAGRWICFAKNYPQYMLSEHSVKLLNQN